MPSGDPVLAADCSVLERESYHEFARRDDMDSGRTVQSEYVLVPRNNEIDLVVICVSQEVIIVAIT
jgi:hypothetical protein